MSKFHPINNLANVWYSKQVGRDVRILRKRKQMIVEIDGKQEAICNVGSDCCTISQEILSAVKAAVGTVDTRKEGVTVD